MNLNVLQFFLICTYNALNKVLIKLLLILNLLRLHNLNNCINSQIYEVMKTFFFLIEHFKYLKI